MKQQNIDSEKQKKIYLILEDAKGWTKKVSVPYEVHFYKYPRKRKVYNFFTYIGEGREVSMDADVRTIDFEAYHRQEDETFIYIYLREMP